MPRRASRSTILLSIIVVSTLLYFYSRSGTGRYGSSAHMHRLSGLSRPKYPAAADEQQAKQMPAEVTEGLNYMSNGLVAGWDKIHRALTKAHIDSDDRHPIVALMDRGRRRWEGMLKRQSKTLPHAVNEYRKRYGRKPPKGFDKWFQFCQENGVKIIDDYDQIDRDIGPWFGLSPAEFRKRVKALDTLPHSYKVVLRPNGQSTSTGDRANSGRAKRQFHQLEPLVPYIGEELTLVFSDHDMGNSVLSDELHEAALNAAAKHTFLTAEELKVYENETDNGMGLLAACSEDSYARKLDRFELTKIEETTFMFDPRPSMSYCENPDLMQYHGAFTYHHRRPAAFRPVFQLSKLAQNNELLVTPLEGYKNHTSSDSQYETSEWEDKTIDKLFWRGKMTGDFYSGPRGSRPTYDWRDSHRPRLHLIAQNDDDEVNLWVRRALGWHKERWNRGDLNERYFDIGMIGEVHQCHVEDGTCDQMKKEIRFKDRVQPRDAIKYKYVMDVDGNGWSSRFHRLLASGSVVVKTTVFPEWMSDWLTPWYHYIPSKPDYSDLYDIMSFFVGPPDGKGVGHDHLGRQMGQNGRQFVLDHWRWEDMQAYMLRLLLEYRRLLHDDRDAYSYGK